MRSVSEGVYQQALFVSFYNLDAQLRGIKEVEDKSQSLIKMVLTGIGVVSVFGSWFIRTPAFHAAGTTSYMFAGFATAALGLSLVFALSGFVELYGFRNVFIGPSVHAIGRALRDVDGVVPPDEFVLRVVESVSEGLRRNAEWNRRVVVRLQRGTVALLAAAMMFALGVGDVLLRHLYMTGGCIPC